MNFIAGFPLHGVLAYHLENCSNSPKKLVAAKGLLMKNFHLNDEDAQNLIDRKDSPLGLDVSPKSVNDFYCQKDSSTCSHSFSTNNMYYKRGVRNAIERFLPNFELTEPVHAKLLADTLYSILVQADRGELSEKDLEQANEKLIAASSTIKDKSKEIDCSRVQTNFVNDKSDMLNPMAGKNFRTIMSVSPLNQ